MPAANAAAAADQEKVEALMQSIQEVGLHEPVRQAASAPAVCSHSPAAFAEAWPRLVNMCSWNQPSQLGGCQHVNIPPHSQQAGSAAAAARCPLLPQAAPQTLLLPGLQIDVLEVEGQLWGFSGCHRYEVCFRAEQLWRAFWGWGRQPPLTLQAGTPGRWGVLPAPLHTSSRASLPYGLCVPSQRLLAFRREMSSEQTSIF